eukprot:365184-Chlamydomonas_euryale.AAC.6
MRVAAAAQELAGPAPHGACRRIWARQGCSSAGNKGGPCRGQHVRVLLAGPTPAHRSAHAHVGQHGCRMRHRWHAINLYACIDWQATVSLSHQLALVEMHLSLAVELQRPVSMHCVRAYGHMTELLRARGADKLPPAIMMHSGIAASVPPMRTLLGNLSEANPPRRTPPFRCTSAVPHMVGAPLPSLTWWVHLCRPSHGAPLPSLTWCMHCAPLPSLTWCMHCAATRSYGGSVDGISQLTRGLPHGAGDRVYFSFSSVINGKNRYAAFCWGQQPADGMENSGMDNFPGRPTCTPVPSKP